MRRTLKLSRLLDPVGVPVNQQFQHRSGIVFRVAHLMLIDLDPQVRKIHTLHKRIISPHRVVFPYILLDA